MILSGQKFTTDQKMARTDKEYKKTKNSDTLFSLLTFSFDLILNSMTVPALICPFLLTTMIPYLSVS